MECKICGTKLNQYGICPACLKRMKKEETKKRRTWLFIGIAAMITALVCAFVLGGLLMSGKKQADTKTKTEEKPPEFVAEDYDQTGTCGEDAQWGFKESTGELTIIGTGAMDDYNFDYEDGHSTAPWAGLDVTAVTIYGATSIGEWAFYDCGSLTEITIGDSVTTIGEWALSYCDSLTEVTIPDSVTAIGDWAFDSCSSLTEITIPDSVTSIGGYAFSCCDSLTAIHADSASYIDVNGVLFTADMLTLVQYPAGKTQNSYIIPDGVAAIGNGAFYGCAGLTEITIGDGVTTIGHHAFDSCDSLADVYYAGTKEQWNAISIDDFNEELTFVTIHYNSGEGQ